MDVTIFDNKKIRFSFGAENVLLAQKSEVDVDAMYMALEKTRDHFYNDKSLKNKDLIKYTFEIHYKQFRVICQLQNTFIEVTLILNKYAFPPDGTPVYEAF